MLVSLKYFKLFQFLLNNMLKIRSISISDEYIIKIIWKTCNKIIILYLWIFNIERANSSKSEPLDAIERLTKRTSIAERPSDQKSSSLNVTPSILSSNSCSSSLSTSSASSSASSSSTTSSTSYLTSSSAVTTFTKTVDNSSTQVFNLYFLE